MVRTSVRVMTGVGLELKLGMDEARLTRRVCDVVQVTYEPS
jgi:hypothetical protein